MPERPAHLFQPGKSGNPNGRPKGIPNKTTTALREMILGALDKAGGLDYLTEQARVNPGPFLALIGKVLPMTLAGDPNAPLAVTVITRRIVDPKGAAGD